MAISAGDAVDLLTAVGLHVEVKSFSDVRIAERNARIRVRQSPPTPSAVKAHGTDDDIVLYVVPHLTENLRAMATSNVRIAVAAIQDGVVIFEGEQFRAGKPNPPRSTPQTRRTAWAWYGLLRALARTKRPRTQTELASEVGSTQAAISLHLRKLEKHVSRGPDGWVANDVGDIARLFLARYPGAKGISQYWYSQIPVVEQARRVQFTYDEVLVSGDAGADELAPWRSPGFAVIYARNGLRLAEIGFAETDRTFATLALTIPADPTIWSIASAFGSDTVVDPLLCAYDVKVRGGSDAEGAVDRLLDWVSERWASGG